MQNGKPRELHIEKSLDVIEVPFVERCADAPVGDLWLRKLYACKYYKVWKGDLDGRETLDQTEPFMIGSVISGASRLDGETFKKGDHFIIPCGYSSILLEGKAEFIFSAPIMS